MTTITLPPKYAERTKDCPGAREVMVWADSRHQFFLGTVKSQSDAVKMLDAFDSRLQDQRKMVDGFNEQERKGEVVHHATAEAAAKEKAEQMMEGRAKAARDSL